MKVIKPKTLSALAELVDGTLEGNPERLVEQVSCPNEAGPDQLTFLFGDPLPATRAQMAVIGPGMVVEGLTDWICAEVPKLAMAQVLGALFPPRPIEPGIDPTAIIDPGARVGQGVAIGPQVLIGPDVEIGEGTIIGHGCSIATGVRIGGECRLFPRVVLYENTQLGHGVTVHAGTVIGSDGFGYLFHEMKHWKIPQVGRVVIEDDVEIGANTTIDCATIGETRIGAGCKIDNKVQIGHNVRIGPLSILCSQVGVAGSTTIGAGCVLAGQVGIADYVEIGDKVQIGAQSGVLSNAAVESESVLFGTPARPLMETLRQQAATAKLPELIKQIRALLKT